MGDSFGNHAEGPFPLTETDKFVLSQTDEEYKYHDWEELREIIGESGCHISTRVHFNHVQRQITSLFSKENRLSCDAT
jgi:hypothetical protein